MSPGIILLIVAVAVLAVAILPTSPRRNHRR